LIQELPNAELLKVELQDIDYDRSILYHSVYSQKTATQWLKFVRKFSSLFTIFGLRNRISLWMSKFLRLPIDQSHFNALAQIFVIVKKKKS